MVYPKGTTGTDTNGHSVAGSGFLSVYLEVADDAEEPSDWSHLAQFSLLTVVSQIGRCRLTVSKPVLKAPMVSASLRFKQQYDEMLSNFAINFNLRRYSQTDEKNNVKQGPTSTVKAGVTGWVGWCRLNRCNPS